MSHGLSSSAFTIVINRNTSKIFMLVVGNLIWTEEISNSKLSDFLYQNLVYLCKKLIEIL